ncbi:Multidrug resistance protein [Aduncisulcus paluster]|uniref:Multidrug resistance protein n=1 Tax=Aduncisulcus paluster TaxID=2918883 RepID=A0ABQ5KIB6_9EUKA|nr:Multidrug resistance protein [Aduncisulcus paluster]
MFAQCAIHFITLPIHIILGLGILFYFVGYAGFAGVGLVILFIPIQTIITGCISARIQKQLRLNDERVRTVNEAISAINLVKACGMELQFSQRIKNSRHSQMLHLLGINFLKQLQVFFNDILPTCVSCVTFSLVALTNNSSLTPEDTFATITMFGILYFPIQFISTLATTAVEGKAALNRIRVFLTDLDENITEDSLFKEDISTSCCSQSVEMVDIEGFMPSKNYLEIVKTSGLSEKGKSSSKSIAIQLGSVHKEEIAEEKEEKKEDGEEDVLDNTVSLELSAQGVDGFWSLDSYKDQDIISKFLSNDSSPASDSQCCFHESFHKSHEEVEKDSFDKSDISEEVSRDDSSDKVILRNLRMRFYFGESVCVIGSVGSGKSSLLSLILGDMETKCCGISSNRTMSHLPGVQISPNARISLAIQSPFIFNDTIRNNIVFGNEFEKDRYLHTLVTCCLVPDLQQFSHGDESIIGEKGHTLSGGQKARISLARAIYNKANILLLDDPLSAVDMHVAQRLVSRIVMNRGWKPALDYPVLSVSKDIRDKPLPVLLASSCLLILTTHQLQFRSFFDRLIVMKKGECIYDGVNCEESESILSSLVLKSEIEKRDHVDSFGGDSDEQDRQIAEIDMHDGARDESMSEYWEEYHQLQSIIKIQGEDGYIESPICIEKHDHEVAESGEYGDSQSETSFSKDDDYSHTESEDFQHQSNEFREQKKTGNIKWEVVQLFLSSGYVALFIIVIVLLISQRVGMIFQDLVISDWSDSVESSVNTNTTFLSIFLVVCGIVIVISLLKAVFIVIFSYNVSRSLHSTLVDSILKTVITFFHVTPIGRISARFSKDMNVIDSKLVKVVFECLSSFTQVFGVLILICIFLPWFLLVVVPISIFYAIILVRFRRTQREVKRWESVTSGPLSSLVVEVLDGLQTIRAFGRERMFFKTFQKYINNNNRAYNVLIQMNRWSSFRLETLSAIIQCTVASILLILNSSRISISIASLLMSYSMNITLALSWIVRRFIEVEVGLNAVERVREYSLETLKEASFQLESDIRLIAAPPKHATSRKPEIDSPYDQTEMVKVAIEPIHSECLIKWPSESPFVTFFNVYMRYRPSLPLVLRDINFHITGGEKVGIVGRTGSGKSSLLLSILRLIELDRECCEDAAQGSILIDGIDIHSLGVHTLRHRIVYIPQDPLLFAGTVMDNLLFAHEESSLGTPSNSEMLKVIYETGLFIPLYKIYKRESLQESDSIGADIIKVRFSECDLVEKADKVFSGEHSSASQNFIDDISCILQVSIMEGGSNLSVGQKQLLCLCRALLRPPTLLLMDEATSSIDRSSDEWIQKCILSRYSRGTVITVAHRLETVMNYDKIVVMEAGQIVEIGTPEELKKKEGGHFRSLLLGSPKNPHLK